MKKYLLAIRGKPENLIFYFSTKKDRDSMIKQLPKRVEYATGEVIE